MGIFNRFLYTYVPFYTRLQIFIQLSSLTPSINETLWPETETRPRRLKIKSRDRDVEIETTTLPGLNAIFVVSGKVV